MSKHPRMGRRIAAVAALSLLAPLPALGTASAAGGSPSFDIVCASLSQEVERNTTTTLALSCVDGDGGPVDRYEVGTPPAKASSFRLDAETGSFDYAPKPGAVGTDTFYFRGVVDGLGKSEPTKAVLTISNQRPTCAPVAPVDAVHDRETTVDISCSDPDGDAVTLATGTIGSSHGRVLLGEGSSVRYVPASGYVGPDAFSVVATDGDKVSEEVLVEVSVVNSRPSCTDRRVSVRHDRTSPFRVSCTDADGDALTTSLASAPQHGTAVVKGGVVRYTPSRGYLGTDRLRVTASDGIQAAAAATVQIEVTNRAPSCSTASPLGVRRSRSAARTLRCTDGDSDSVRLKIVRQPRAGRAVVRDRTTVVVSATRRARGRTAVVVRPTDGISTGRARAIRVVYRR